MLCCDGVVLWLCSVCAIVFVLLCRDVLVLSVLLLLCRNSLYRVVPRLHCNVLRCGVLFWGVVWRVVLCGVDWWGVVCCVVMWYHCALLCQVESRLRWCWHCVVLVLCRVVCGCLVLRCVVFDCVWLV